MPAEPGEPRPTALQRSRYACRRVGDGVSCCVAITESPATRCWHNPADRAREFAPAVERVAVVGLSLPETDVVRLVRLVRPAPERAEVFAREQADESGAGCRGGFRRLPRRLATGGRHSPPSWPASSRSMPIGSRPRFSAAGSAVHIALAAGGHFRPFTTERTSAARLGGHFSGGGGIQRVRRSSHATRAAPVPAPYAFFAGTAFVAAAAGKYLVPRRSPVVLSFFAAIMRMIGSCRSFFSTPSAFLICSTDWPGFFAT